MGFGGEYVCNKCGYVFEGIMVGSGFMSCPCDPEIGDKILNGEYGEKAKKVLEDNPDSEFSFYMGIFQCGGCWNVINKDVVRIWSRGRKVAEGVPWTFGGPRRNVYEKGKLIYRPIMKCDKCGRRMREDNNSPSMPCPKCDGTMLFMEILLWD